MYRLARITTAAVLVGIAMLQWSALSHAGGSDGIDLTVDVGSGGLPRNYGPFKLQMSAERFASLTKVQPEFCPVCITGELYASLNSEQAKQFIKGFPPNEGMDFFFYQGKLFHMTMAPEFSDLQQARNRYTQMFGNNGKAVDQKNGTSMLKWEDKGTLITVNYSNDDETVFAVNLYDWGLKKERDWQESVLFQQGATAALP